MATIKSTLALYDGMTGPLRSIHKALNIVLNSFDAMQVASGKAVDTSSIQAAREELARAGAGFEKIEQEIRDAGQAQERFNGEIRAGTRSADGLSSAFSKLKTIAATLGIASGIKNMAGLSDQFSSTRARLKLIADDGGSVAAVEQKLDALSQSRNVDIAAVTENGDIAAIEQKLHNVTQSRNIDIATDVKNNLDAAAIPITVTDNGSVEALEEKIMASAQRARASYFDTASAIASMGANARSAFSTNDELIAFMEQINKQFVIGGTSAQGQAAAMLQLTQAMGAGALRGEELNSILENAPGVARAIEQYMGVAEGSIKKYAEQSLISADIVKNSMFAAADETNAKFESMPMTWGQVWTSMQNTALTAFQPALQRINELANSEAAQQFTQSAEAALMGLAGFALDVVNGLAAGADFVATHLDVIGPVIGGVAAALGAYTAALTVYNAVKGISAVAEAVHGAAMAFSAGQTFAATAAQYGFNAALLACPVFWIITGIVALIAVIYLAVGAFNRFSGASVSATGIVAGAFAVLGAFIVNTFVAPLWNTVASVANFIGNVFNDPIAAVKVRFYDMALTVVGYIRNMARAIEAVINKIPGVTVSITGGLDSFYNSLEQAQQNVKDESGWVEYIQKMDIIDYADAAKSGYQFGKDLAAKFSGTFKEEEPSDPLRESISTDKIEDLLGGIYGNTGDTAAHTAETAEAVSIADEDLKYMRDIAERDTINRFTTAEIKIEQTNNNRIESPMDLDGIVNDLTNAMSEAVAVSAKGAHA